MVVYTIFDIVLLLYSKITFVIKLDYFCFILKTGTIVFYFYYNILLLLQVDL